MKFNYYLLLKRNDYVETCQSKQRPNFGCHVDALFLSVVSVTVSLSSLSRNVVVVEKQICEKYSWARFTHFIPYLCRTCTLAMCVFTVAIFSASPFLLRFI